MGRVPGLRKAALPGSTKRNPRSSGADAQSTFWENGLVEFGPKWEDGAASAMRDCIAKEKKP
jgi:hypothetical protein